jgi:hypothetical protein
MESRSNFEVSCSGSAIQRDSFVRDTVEFWKVCMDEVFGPNVQGIECFSDVEYATTPNTTTNTNYATLF